MAVLLCLYLFRHSYITGKLVAGVDSAIVKDLAGHVDAQMINRVYGHVAENWEFMAGQANRKNPQLQPTVAKHHNDNETPDLRSDGGRSAE